MDIKNIRRSFPILDHPIHGHPLAYLDNAATTQKPSCVIEALSNYYTKTNANIHRSAHHLSEKATEAYENTRLTVQKFIHAKHPEECIFTKGSTDAINLVANSFGEQFVKAGDEILISALEHHSNIVPWQMLCERKQAHLKIIPMTSQGELELDKLDELLTPKTKILSITHASNALGTLSPLKEIIQRAHAHNVPVFVDGAQSTPHININVQDLGCDFFTFSGHKIYGPTGVGVLYGKKHWLEAMPPYQGGGNMISKVTFTKTSYKQIPYKFEAGTPPIASIIALKTALEYLQSLNFEDILKHEMHLLSYATRSLLEIPGLQLIGTAKNKIGVISFTLEGIHPHDISTIVDQYGVALRSGHHCAMPIMDFLGIPATARISFGIYNTLEDIDQLINALHEVKRVFKQ